MRQAVLAVRLAYHGSHHHTQSCWAVKLNNKDHMAIGQPHIEDLIFMLKSRAHGLATNRYAMRILFPVRNDSEEEPDALCGLCNGHDTSTHWFKCICLEMLWLAAVVAAAKAANITGYTPLIDPALCEVLTWGISAITAAYYYRRFHYHVIWSSQTVCLALYPICT